MLGYVEAIMNNELLDTTAAAGYLGVSRVTLESWRLKRIGPAWIRLGDRLVRYELRDLRAWIAARREVTTGDQSNEK